MEPSDPLIPPPLSRSVPRLILRLAIIAALVWGGLSLFNWLQAHIADLEDAARARALTTLVIVSVVAYALIIAIPFVPAIEIGIALMVMEGSIIAPFVWLATVLGLLIAFGFGRWVSLDWLHGFFRDLHMRRACEMVSRIKTQAPQARLAAVSAVRRAGCDAERPLSRLACRPCHKRAGAGQGDGSAFHAGPASGAAWRVEGHAVPNRPVEIIAAMICSGVWSRSTTTAASSACSGCSVASWLSNSAGGMKWPGR